MNPTSFILTAPPQGVTLKQHTPQQDDFQAVLERQQGQREAIDWLHLRRAEGQEDLTFPQMLPFRWRSAPGAVAEAVEVAGTPSFGGHVFRFPASPGRDEALVHSLEAGRPYWWRVAGQDAQGPRVVSAAGHFRTADETPRWIRVEGVSNVRDLGGWRTRDGRRIRQGLVYRGGELSSHMTATPAGLRFVEEGLALRSILDLRNARELQVDPRHGSALSPRVRWLNAPLAAYAAIDTDEQRTLYAHAFRLCCDPANLPTYIHCWGGADRTGTFVLLLNAILGVPDEDLLRDYELTSLSIWEARSRNSDLFRAFDAMLDTLLPGASYEDKARAYFHAAGLADFELDRFRQQMLE